jgi:hypothetical protein
MTTQLCLNCGERPAVASHGGKTAPLCEVCSPKAGASRGVKMAPKKPRLKVLNGGRSA